MKSVGTGKIGLRQPAARPLERQGQARTPVLLENPPLDVEADAQSARTADHRALRGAEQIVGYDQAKHVAVGSPLDAERISVGAIVQTEAVGSREPFRHQRDSRSEERRGGEKQ